MALITDLPAASGLSNTDLLVIDTGSQTQKIQAQNAGATTSNAGLVTTGAQTLAGTKTFLKTVVVDDTTSNGSGLSFRFSDKNNDAYAAMWTAFSNYGGRLFFRETSGNASGVTDYNEVYRLPNPDAERTSNATYDILTTKNFTTTLWFESAGSQTYSLTNYHHYLVTISRYVAGSSADNLGLYIVGARVNVPTNSAAVRTIISSNVATVSASGSSLTITASATYIKATIIDLL